MDHRLVLLSAIDAFLREDLALSEFREQYYNYYIDQLPEWALTDRERAFFGAVQEKLDWVDLKPDLESRNAGWIDHDQFTTWLRVEREAFVEE